MGGNIFIYIDGPLDTILGDFESQLLASHIPPGDPAFRNDSMYDRF